MVNWLSTVAFSVTRDLARFRRRLKAWRMWSAVEARRVMRREDFGLAVGRAAAKCPALNEGRAGVEAG